MAISIHRDSNVGVACTLANDLCVDTLFDQQSDMTVPKIVETNALDIGFCEDPGEVPRERIRRDRVPIATVVNQVLVLVQLTYL